MLNNLHQEIYNKLDYFINTKKIPHIIFHGSSGSGKRTIVNNFINKIYNNDNNLKNKFVMIVNCSNGKGIKFIREDLKFFAKTHINFSSKGHFKSVLLYNADKLTIDAQSALRRCIEIFSHTTRFFIIVENKDKLLKPILSRLCDIYVHEPRIDNQIINLHKYNVNNKFKFFYEIDNKRMNFLKKNIDKLKTDNYENLIYTTNLLYDNAVSTLDIIKFLENYDMDETKKYKLLLTYNKIKSEIRCEKLLIFFMLNFIFIRSDVDLENISFM